MFQLWLEFIVNSTTTENYSQHCYRDEKSLSRARIELTPYKSCLMLTIKYKPKMNNLLCLFWIYYRWIVSAEKHVKEPTVALWSINTKLSRLITLVNDSSILGSISASSVSVVSAVCAFKFFRQGNVIYVKFTNSFTTFQTNHIQYIKKLYDTIFRINSNFGAWNR